MSTYLFGFGKYARANADVDATGQRALIAGGTQGIGAGIALRFAQAGSEVWVVGRNRERAEALLERLSAASEELARRNAAAEDDKRRAPRHAFFQADLSSVAEVQRVARQISERADRGGIDHLIETQGGPPNGTWIAASNEGDPEQSFAVQVFSRFALADLLTSAGSVRRSVTFVAAPGAGGKAELDVDDVDFAKARKEGRFKEGFTSIPKVGARDSSVLDAVAQTLAERNPTLTVSHLFPGVVATDAVSNRGFPSALVTLSKLFSPIVANKPGPGGFAELPFYLLNTSEGRRYLRVGEANCFTPYLRRLDVSANVREPSVRERLWKRLESYYR